MPHSFWEKEIYFRQIDYVIVGSGIVGLSTGISILEKEPKANVLIVDKESIPTGASTRNAGFACFGSLSELMDDLNQHSEESVFTLFKRRFQGIQKLLSRCGNSIDYHPCGGYEIFHNSDYLQYIPLVNDKIFSYTGIKDHFSTVSPSTLEEQGLSSFSAAVFTPNEAYLHPMLMIQELQKRFVSMNGKLLMGCSVHSWNENDSHININLGTTEITAKALIVCINGFAKQLLPELEVHAARNQVFVLETEQQHKLQACYHYNKGYVYFRKIDSKHILIGGGRDQDIEQEYQTNFEINPKISQYLLTFAQTNILTNITFKIKDHWGGILGLGPSKSTIIKACSPRVFAAVRMGGMGVALGSLVGEETAELVLEKTS